MGKFDTNPFDRSALTDSRLLAGRNNEFRQIRFVLRNASKQEHRIKSIMISGDRGVGKTSFLNLIANECPVNDIIVVRLNLTESNSKNTNEFFWYLFSQTISTLLGMKLLGGHGGDIEAAIQKIIISDGLTDVVNWVFKTPLLHKAYLTNSNTTFHFDSLIDDLTLLRKEVSNDKRFDVKTKFLFLVDEAQNIYSNTQIIEEIRYIIQNQQLGYGFVFAGDNSYEKAQWDVVFGGTHREFEIINLNYFDDVDSIKEYFRKSLESIGWSKKEIETDLFYRFNVACGHIFNLTSGKPAWINEIAEKMFERCMKGESSLLKFDRNAQNDVKNILLASKQIDSAKLDFIESLSIKHQKWVSKIFASEFSTFNQIYFYTKFIYIGENLLSIEEYRNFCKLLIDKGILYTFDRAEKPRQIGFLSGKKNNDLLDSRFVAFREESDAIKLWLQVNSDGKYSFSRSNPDFSYIDYINTELSTDSKNTFVISSPFTSQDKIEDKRLLSITEEINKGEFNVEDANYDLLYSVYKLFKRLAKSRCKELLFIKLEDKIASKIKVWNVYNYNEHDRLVEFNQNTSVINRIVSTVNKYNSSETIYNLEISIDRLEEPKMDILQNLIIRSGDSRKRAIVINDKMDELVRFYITDHNVESSYNVASYIFNLFEDGYDLGLRELNNTAYVFLAKNEIEKAQLLLKEGQKKLKNEPIEKDDYDSAALIKYNTAILYFKQAEFDKCLEAFKDLIDFTEEHPVDLDMGALFILESYENHIELRELHHDTEPRELIRLKEKAISNFGLLKKFIANQGAS